MCAQVTTNRHLRVRDPHLAARTCVLIVVVVLVWLGSTSCGSRRGSNPSVPVPSATLSYTSASSGIISVPEGQVARVFAEPSLSSTVVTTLPKGTKVEVLCTAQGDTVASDSGAVSSLWDKTQYGYLPDVNVYTGTDQAVAPSCF
jgi:SH3 domain-containing protein